MNATSAWLLSANSKLNDSSLIADYERQQSAYTFKVYLIDDWCWLVTSWPKGQRIAFRLAYSPNDRLDLKQVLDNDARVTFHLASLMGEYEAVAYFIPSDLPVIRLTTTLKTTVKSNESYYPSDRADYKSGKYA